MINILLALFAAPLLCADTFPEIYNSEPGNPQPMPATEALGKLRMPEGFQATVFAAEPDVQNPIACAWDHKGRLWVAENYTYAETAKRFDLGLNDRVIILEDKDNDGHAETRTVFTDQVKMLSSVELAPDGVYLMCPPQLLFIPDKNHDDIPDGPPEVVLDGFDVAKDSYHNFANGLRFGSDGWLYGRSGIACPGHIGKPGTADKDRLPTVGGIWRYHPERGTAEVLCSGTTNPWGHDWDENGEMFFSNTVTGHLWHMIPGAHFKSMYGAGPNPAAYERMDQTADHYHWDKTGNWEESRDGKADDFGGGHSHIGGMIYQADQWPEKYRGKYMTLNQHGRRVNVDRLERQGSGYTGKHEPDIIFSDDPWFRGIDLTTGPDGSVFILDWSDTGECHDHTGVHRESGRIFKISYGKPSSPELSLLDDLSPDGVEKIIRHPNVWYFRRLNVLLQGKPLSPELTTRIREIAKHDSKIPVQLRAASLLQSHGLLDIDAISKLAESKEEHIQAFAVRAALDKQIIDRPDGGVPPAAGKIPEANYKLLLNMAGEPQTGLVKLWLASGLQRLAPAQRMIIAPLLASDGDYRDDPALPYLIWFAAANAWSAEPSRMNYLATRAASEDLVTWTARFFASDPEKKGEGLAELLAAPLASGMKKPVLQGISEAYAGFSTAPKPEGWDAFAASVTDPASKVLLQKINILFGDTSTIDSRRATVLDDKAAMGERQQALDILIDAKVPGLRELCEKVIATPTLNGNALRGLHLSQDGGSAKLILENYEHFLPANRSALFDILVGRPDWTSDLLDAIASGKVPKTDLPAFSARRITEMNRKELTARLTEHWGSINGSPEGKKKEIADLKAKLTSAELAKADLENGHKIFTSTCATCHTLKGDGGNLGPDLTGSGRSNLDYLLENIVSPSSVVPADYRMTILTMKDGRSLAGAISGKTEKTLTLRLPTGDTTVPTADITDRKTMETSMMPEGLLTTLTPEQIRDLIAFLMK